MSQPTPHHSARSTLTGFVLALGLTLAAFYLVQYAPSMGHSLRQGLLVGLAVAQLIVQVHYFLHVDGSNAQRWNLGALVYTLFIAVLLIGGTLWIMHNTRVHMMSGS